MVLPLGDDNSDRVLFPFETIGLIVVNVLVFVFLQGMGTNEDFTYAWSTVPEEIITGKDQVIEPHEEVGEYQGQQVQYTSPGLRPTPGSVYLTLLTSMFMHGSIMHLLGNMWFLWIFGDNIENDLGYIRYLPFYLVCGLLASLTHVFMNMTGPDSMIPSLGASGAISGVMGAYLVMHPQGRVTVILFRIITHVPGFVAVGLWFAMQVIFSMLNNGDGVAYAAHIGGFIAGAALVKPFMLGRRPALPNRSPGRHIFDA